MNLFDQWLAWLSGDDFRGVPGIPGLVLEHLLLSVAATLVAVLVALPLALWLGHLGRGGALAINVANVFRAVPAFGLLLFFFSVFGFGTTPLVAVFATIALAPIFTNAYVGIRTVDPEVRESAEGMGLTGFQTLRQVEIPIALPVIMAGIRTSAVNVVATVPLAAVAGFDGLGRPLINGLNLGLTISGAARVLVITGAALVALLSIGTEWLLGRVERRIVPAALQDRNRHNDPRQERKGNALHPQRRPQVKVGNAAPARVAAHSMRRG